MMSRADSEPRANRTSLMLGADVFTGSGQPTMHRALNLSATGICIAQPKGLTIGKHLAISIGRLDHVPAQVVWLRAGLAGLRFLDPIDVVAARQRRVGSAQPSALAAGWLADLDDAYRASRR